MYMHVCMYVFISPLFKGNEKARVKDIFLWFPSAVPVRTKKFHVMTVNL